MANWPILVKPAAICRKRQRRCQQSGKRPVNAIISGVIALSGKSTVSVVRQDSFIGDGGIIKAKRAVKIAIAGDAMGIRRVRPNQRCDHDRGDTD